MVNSRYSNDKFNQAVPAEAKDGSVDNQQQTKPLEPGYGSGTLFLNKFKKADHQPEWQGSARFLIPEGFKAGDEIEFQIAGFDNEVKQGKNQGDPYTGLRLTESGLANQKREAAKAAREQGGGGQGSSTARKAASTSRYQKR